MLFWIILVVSLPFLVWVWLGVTFTILIYVANSVREIQMQEQANDTAMPVQEVRRDRLIRYTSIGGGLLSIFDPKLNILYIDREEAARLPDFVRNNLETKSATTMVTNNGSGITFRELDS